LRKKVELGGYLQNNILPAIEGVTVNLLVSFCVASQQGFSSITLCCVCFTIYYC